MKIKRIKICGSKYKVKYVSDKFCGSDLHFGAIEHGTNTIYINKSLSKDEKKETLFHEMLHAMLVHIGRDELSEDESFVQGLANTLFQHFDFKESIYDN